MRSALSVVYVVLILWGVAAAQSTPSIMVLGDSLSSAYGMATDQGWVNLLQQRLDREGYSLFAFKARVS